MPNQTTFDTQLDADERHGLYDEANEHDGCGVALVARLNGIPVHETIQRALSSLCNMEHRGGEGADAMTGDGAGISVQMPDRLLRAVSGVELPRARRRESSGGRQTVGGGTGRKGGHGAPPA